MRIFTYTTCSSNVGTRTPPPPSGGRVGEGVNTLNITPHLTSPPEGGRNTAGIISLCFIVFSFICLIYIPAYAEDSPQNPHFKDWLHLSDYLRSKGVDPVAVSWGSIEPLCLGLKKAYNDQVEYNQCKFEKALDQFDYNADSHACEAQGKTQYPSTLRFRQPVRTVVVTNATGGQTTIEESAPALSNRQLDDLRRAEYITCMRGLGWRNPDSWLTGRRQP